MIELLSLLIFSQAQAWEHHQVIMSQILDTQAAGERNYLKTTIVVPAVDEQKKIIFKLASELAVNAEKIPLVKPGVISVREFIQGESVDEPDFGMDQDLPDSVDPEHDRAWMGGSVGPTSQGFRHMFFSGMECLSPLRTLQIPFRSLGQSPDRILKLKTTSQKFLAEKNLFWGLRILLWQLHFVQDLHQPFHTTQVPYFRMLPWRNLLKNFVSRSTQVIANYHYAYEGLVYESLREGRISKLAPCFELNEKSVLETGYPEVPLSRQKAHDIGVPLFHLWDTEMKDPLMNLPEGEGSIDYYSYLHTQDDRVDELLKNTCELMKHLSAQSFAELDQFFKDQ